MSKTNLLVIDDYPTICEFARLIAEGLDFIVTKTNCPVEFRKQSTLLNPEAVMLDLSFGTKRWFRAIY